MFFLKKPVEKGIFTFGDRINLIFLNFLILTLFFRKTCGGKVFLVKKGPNPTYYSYYTEGGEKKGAWYGNAQMTDQQKINSTISAMPAGSYYVMNQADFPKADCADKNRDGPGSDGCCGECKDGYEEDSTGTCVEVQEEEVITTQTDVSSQVEPEEGDNTLLYGAIAVAVLGGAFMFLK